MSTVKFSCRVAPSNADAKLGLEIWIDQNCFVSIDHVNEPRSIEHDFSDDEGQRQLRIVLKNKLPEHTKIDQSNQIVSDAMIAISDICFDDIDCMQLIRDRAVYRHNFNGSAEDINDQFFGDMGCNGSVEFDFSTPLYLWLLENM